MNGLPLLCLLWSRTPVHGCRLPDLNLASNARTCSEGICPFILIDYLSDPCTTVSPRSDEFPIYRGRDGSSFRIDVIGMQEVFGVQDPFEMLGETFQ